jgi:hypothetical protein
VLCQCRRQHFDIGANDLQLDASCPQSGAGLQQGGHIGYATSTPPPAQSWRTASSVAAAAASGDW